MMRRPLASAISMRPPPIGPVRGLSQAQPVSSIPAGFAGQERRHECRRGLRSRRRCPHLPAPREQLRRRQAIPPRRRRNPPRPAEAFRDDPRLLLFRPAPARAARDHLEPGNLWHRRMTKHTPMSSALTRAQDGPRRRLTNQMHKLSHLRAYAAPPSSRPSRHGRPSRKSLSLSSAVRGRERDAAGLGRPTQRRPCWNRIRGSAAGDHCSRHSLRRVGIPSDRFAHCSRFKQR